MDLQNGFKIFATHCVLFVFLRIPGWCKSGFLQKVLGVKECLFESKLVVKKLACVEAGVWKTLEIEQKGVEGVDASSMAIRVHERRP